MIFGPLQARVFKAQNGDDLDAFLPALLRVRLGMQLQWDFVLASRDKALRLDCYVSRGPFMFRSFAAYGVGWDLPPPIRQEASGAPVQATAFSSTR